MNMLLYDSGKAFVKLDGDVLQVEVKGELDENEFKRLFGVVEFALDIYGGGPYGPYNSRALRCIRRCNHHKSCAYFSVKNVNSGAVGIIFLSSDLKLLKIDLKTCSIESNPEYLANASRLLASRFGHCVLPEVVRAENGVIEFEDFHFSYSCSKKYRAILHADSADSGERNEKDGKGEGKGKGEGEGEGGIEYRIEVKGTPTATTPPEIFAVKDVIRNGETFLLFKEALHPFGTVFYDLQTDEIRYDRENGYGNKVAEFWRKVRKSEMKILGDDMQLKVLKALETKSVDDVLEWYKKQHNRLYEALEKNEEVRRLYVRLATECVIETGGCTLAVLPTTYTTLVFIRNGKCDVLTLKKAAGGKGWVKRKREVYKVLRRLMKARVDEAVEAAEESGAVRLDEGEAGELLASEFRSIREGKYYAYVTDGGRMYTGWDPGLKKLPEVLLPRLPPAVRHAILAALL